ncbi:cation:proton antiporter [Demetria terragena]|uniref:cation:proton antiporter n=1 Tax=Demetria terragena TaxID=63959 RepID=UPI00038169C5|nr:sodium:proton antiporter [Demetria terragena]
MEFLVIAVVGLVVIALSTLLGPRLGVAAPLLLVVIGVGASLLPVFDGVLIEPEWILEGLLPPLLYSAAVSMPPMNFRREFGAISGLSVVLVVGTSLLLGLFFMLVLPDLGFAWGVALGAIISPTDAVATSIVKRSPVSTRVVALLDGESLLNDATALVLLRTAILATASAFSFWGALGTFAYSVIVAVVVGGLVGALNLAGRQRVSDPTVNTVLSFTVPFLASIPAELLNGSGLVAAVVAGLVTGVRAPRELSPQSRLSDAQNWRTVELVLEGIVFLTMGLQIESIVRDVIRDHDSVGIALVAAGGALALTVLIRAAFVAPLLYLLSQRARRGSKRQDWLQSLQENMQSEDGMQTTRDMISARSRRAPTERDVARFRTRVTRALADMDFFLKQPLGWRDGAVVVWAGMRGAITVAAAQTLPEDAPQRPLLILVAFIVALASLLIQGGTMGALVSALTRDAGPSEEDRAEREAEQVRIIELLRDAGATIPEVERDDQAPRTEQFNAATGYRLAVLEAQRTAILDARDDGTFAAELLENTLDDLDASQIAIEMRSTHVN